MIVYIALVGEVIFRMQSDEKNEASRNFQERAAFPTQSPALGNFHEQSLLPNADVTARESVRAREPAY